MPVKLAPSILACDFTRLGDEVSAIASAEYIHVDVMDGSFVPNISFGIPVLAAAKRAAAPGQFIDVHLMITRPDRYLDAFAEGGAAVIHVHLEACPHLHRTLTRIRELGCRAGVALNPHTPVAGLEDVLDQIDVVLLMSVNPGFGGQAFIPSTLDKLRAVRDRSAA